MTITPLSPDEVYHLVEGVDWKHRFDSSMGAILMGRVGNLNVAFYPTGIDREIRVDIMDEDNLVWTVTQRDEDKKFSSLYRIAYDIASQKMKERDKIFHNRCRYNDLLMRLTPQETDLSGFEAEITKARSLLPKE